MKDYQYPDTQRRDFSTLDLLQICTYSILAFAWAQLSQKENPLYRQTKADLFDSVESHWRRYYSESVQML